jgi:heme exporter protein C
MDKPAIHLSMLLPLLLMAGAFQFYYFTVLLMRARVELLDRERRGEWAKDVVSE